MEAGREALSPQPSLSVPGDRCWCRSGPLTRSLRCRLKDTGNRLTNNEIKVRENRTSRSIESAGRCIIDDDSCAQFIDLRHCPVLYRLVVFVQQISIVPVIVAGVIFPASIVCPAVEDNREKRGRVKFFAARGVMTRKGPVSEMKTMSLVNGRALLGGLKTGERRPAKRLFYVPRKKLESLLLVSDSIPFDGALARRRPGKKN